MDFMTFTPTATLPLVPHAEANAAPSSPSVLEIPLASDFHYDSDAAPTPLAPTPTPTVGPSCTQTLPEGGAESMPCTLDYGPSPLDVITTTPLLPDGERI